MAIQLMLARLWLQHLKSRNTADTCEVNEWHSIQCNSFGELKTLYDDWLGLEHVLKGKVRGRE